MTPTSTIQPDFCRVLAEDSSLAEAIPLDRRDRAVEECVAAVRTLPVGPRPRRASRPEPEGIGLLILEGLLVRRVGIDGRFGAELLGEGDVLRPQEGESEPLTLPLTTAWRVLESTRLAVLDEGFVRHLVDYPELAGQLVGRAVGRSRNLAVNMAIVHHARVDVRLHMLFWHLAGRWGHVGSEGVTVPLRLTHAVLAELTAARRPTVTSALSQLSKAGMLASTDTGWMLYGDPPGELHEFGPVASVVPS